MLKAVVRWHKTRLGYLVFGLAELVIAYAFMSLAIDRGTWWWYILTLIFLVGFLQNFTRLGMRLVKRK